MKNKRFDVIIVGGSYSGLAAAMALGRALMKVLVFDSDDSCNKQTPHSHNFLTQDGKTPGEIRRLAREQALQYKTMEFLSGIVLSARKISEGDFEVKDAKGELFKAGQLIFATGIQDIMLDIPGFVECWGISVLHCPYCHGFEVKNEATGILGKGGTAFEMAAMISNWTDNLTIFTDGSPDLTEEQELKLKSRNIRVEGRKIARLDHLNGQLKQVLFDDGTAVELKAIYYRPMFEQHCKVPLHLGCELTEDGYLKVDQFQMTSVNDVFACGDNASRTRTVANAVAMGTAAGIFASRKRILERF